MKIANKDKSIVIVGKNYSNILVMARAFNMDSYNVEVLRLFNKKPGLLRLTSNIMPESKSRYVNKYSTIIVNDNSDKVIELLLEMGSRENKKLLIPVDDYSCTIIDSNLDRLIEQFIIPNISGIQGEIVRLMNKSTQKKLAAKFDIPILESSIIDYNSSFFELPKDIPFPCFVKPNNSVFGSKSKMTKCDNREQLVSLLKTYKNSETIQLLAEKYVEINEEYSLLGISTQEGVYLNCIFKATISGKRERKGVALAGLTENCIEYEEIIEKCKRFVKSLNFTGLFDIDLIKTNEGDIYFTEINFRAGASLHVFTKQGNNLPIKLADYLMSNCAIDNSNDFTAKPNVRFVSEKVMLEEYIRGDISKNKMMELLENSDVYFIKDEMDPEPYYVFKKLYNKAGLLRVIYRIKG